MGPRNVAKLTATLLMLIVIAACQQPPKDDPPADASPPALKAQRSEPGWTVGWSQLNEDMDAVEVLSLLDEPRHIKVNKVNTTWYYSDRRAAGPHVVFDTRRMRVKRWRAP
jgi:hypothetical protein